MISISKKTIFCICVLESLRRRLLKWLFKIWFGSSYSQRIMCCKGPNQRNILQFAHPPRPKCQIELNNIYLYTIYISYNIMSIYNLFILYHNIVYNKSTFIYGQHYHKTFLIFSNVFQSNFRLKFHFKFRHFTYYILEIVAYDL